MENIKYILIVSQYYYSYQCIIVSAEEKNYREKALAFIENLEDYKCSNGDKCIYSYGANRDNAYTEINQRWNINDIGGDIYFIPCKSVTEALRKSEEFNNVRRYKSSKKVEKDISEHHLHSRIIQIANECFNEIK